LLNSSMVSAEEFRNDLRVLEIPSNELANEKLSNTRVANIIILGAYIAITNVVTIDSIVESLKKVLPERRHNLIPLNRQALELGAELVKQAEL